ncbi:MAG: ribonuclease J [Ruminococcaceae bacterium]|nr:ribonuclease J [Oscillospiraceae bacterium]
MAKKTKAKLKVMALGGLGEIGKNMTVLEYGNDIIVIDCGIAFPDEEMPGIDLVIPDITYLEQNAEKIRGILLTHGHEDHVGAIPYVLRSINPPIYGTRLTLGIVEKKLSEHRLPFSTELVCVNAGDTVQLGAFSAEFIRVNHSIADACCIAVKTPVGTVVHSGDFKLDLTPIDGKMMDLTRLGEIGNRGVLLLMCESTNAERPGFTPSEKKVGQSLEGIFERNADKRIVIATFSSNVHRVQQIINTSARYGRKVAVTGRSMINIVGAAVELGYMQVPDGVLIDINEIKKYKPDQLTLITTGSQGEPMSALSRMASGEHDRVTLSSSDLVVISANAIPGNEKLVGKVINSLLARGVNVLYDAVADVHVSGHACQEELKLMHALLRPKFFIPIHGEYRHLVNHKKLAEFMGMPESNVLISEIGKVIEVDKDSMRFNGTVPSGKLLVDGFGVGDVGNIVLRDRKHLSQDGLVVVVASVDMEQRLLVSGPDIVSRGFVYVRESEELMEETRQVALAALEGCLDRGVSDWMEMKGKLRDDIARFISKETKRKPMILPIIMSV